MIRDGEKDAAICKIIEKLQKSSLFLEMKADLQVSLSLKQIYFARLFVPGTEVKGKDNVAGAV